MKKFKECRVRRVCDERSFGVHVNWERICSICMDRKDDSLTTRFCKTCGQSISELCVIYAFKFIFIHILKCGYYLMILYPFLTRIILFVHALLHLDM
jgi:hypothetical protein